MLILGTGPKTRIGCHGINKCGEHESRTTNWEKEPWQKPANSTNRQKIVAVAGCSQTTEQWTAKVSIISERMDNKPTATSSRPSGGGGGEGLPRRDSVGRSEETVVPASPPATSNSEETGAGDVVDRRKLLLRYIQDVMDLVDDMD